MRFQAFKSENQSHSSIPFVSDFSGFRFASEPRRPTCSGFSVRSMRMLLARPLTEMKSRREFVRQQGEEGKGVEVSGASFDDFYHMHILIFLARDKRSLLLCLQSHTLQAARQDRILNAISLFFPIPRPSCQAMPATSGQS